MESQQLQVGMTIYGKEPKREFAITTNKPYKIYGEHDFLFVKADDENEIVLLDEIVDTHFTTVKPGQVYSPSGQLCNECKQYVKDENLKNHVCLPKQNTDEPVREGTDSEIDIAINILGSKLNYDSSEMGHAYGTLITHFTTLQSRVQELEREHDEICKEITRLQQNYDENGYEYSPLIKLQRLEQSMIYFANQLLKINTKKKELEITNTQLTSQVERLRGVTRSKPSLFENGRCTICGGTQCDSDSHK